MIIMKNIVFLLLLLSSIPGFAQKLPMEKNPTIDSLISTVTNLSKKGDSSAALEMINKAALDYPDNPKLLTARGLLLAGTFHDIAAAYSDFDRVVNLWPLEGSIYLLRARCAMDLKKFKQANTDFIKAYQFMPKQGYPDYTPAGLIDQINLSAGLTNLKAYEFLKEGSALIESKDYNRALEKFSKAIKTDKNYAPAYSLRGLMYQMLNNNDKAIADYKKCLELNPYSDMALFGLAEIQKLREDYHSAIATYENLLRLKPDHLPALVGIGLSLYKTGEKNKACEYWTKAMNAGSLQAKDYLGKVCGQ